MPTGRDNHGTPCALLCIENMMDVFDRNIQMSARAKLDQDIVDLVP